MTARPLPASMVRYLAAAPVTRTGWLVGAIGAALVVIATPLGWAELRLAGIALLILLVLAMLSVLGGGDLDLSVHLDPHRLTPTRSSRSADIPVSTVTVHVRNPRRRVRRAITLDIPVGAATGRFAVPALPPDTSHDVVFTVPGERRGVITIGPVTTVRGDVFGLTRREVSSADAVELFVHPRVSPIPALDAGLVRDLEGRQTQEPSAADLDFHTLRPYAPGDDRRHIHWLSSARASATAGRTTLLTKTYTDTRRSHLGVLLDGRATAYAGSGEDAFELAVETAASVANRACQDDIDVTVLASEEVLDRRGIVATLDGLARVTPGPHDLPVLAAHLSAVAPGTSIVLLVTGADTSVADIRRARAVLPTSVRAVAVRVEPGATSRTASLDGLVVLTLGSADDLGRLVRAGGL